MCFKVNSFSCAVSPARVGTAEMGRYCLNNDDGFYTSLDGLFENGCSFLIPINPFGYVFMQMVFC